jgi:diguanylate cyclase (GGDEF)-like protein
MSQPQQPELGRGGDHRLEVLEATHLLDSPAERAFDRLTRLAAALLRAPVALVSLVDERRQFFKSAIGLQEPWASKRETPLTHSFCQHATHQRTPLIVSDTRDHPVLRENLAIRDLNVIAYAGIPLIVDDEAIGAFCVVDTKPRHWSQEELGILSDLSESVVAEIELRLALRAAREQRALTEALLENIGDGVLAVQKNGTFLIANAAARRLFADGAVAGKPMPADWATMHRSIRPDGTPMPSEDGALSRAMRGEKTDGLEFTLERPGASAPIWVEASGRAVRGANGEIVAGVAVYRDVTDRKHSADLYKALATNIPRGAVFLFDPQLRCLALDGEIAKRGGLVPKDPIGRTLRELAGYTEADREFDPVDDAYRRTLAGESMTIDHENRGQTFALHTAPIRDALGRVSSGIALALDVTAERKTEAALRKSEEVYRAIVQHLPNGAVMMVDRDLRYVTADGPVISDLLARANLKGFVGHTVAELSSDANREEIVDLYRQALAGERVHREVQRGDRFYDLDVVPLFERDKGHGGEPVSHALIFLYDVTTRKAEHAELEKARAALEKSAHELREASVTDELTGLLNRRGFQLIAEQEMKVAARGNHKLVLFFADLNGMKDINDTLGHKMGDRALVDTARLLRRVFRDSDVIARLGGDEFVVLATDATVECTSIAARVKEAIAEYNGSTSPFRLSLSLGTSVFDPAEPATLEKLIADADARMYDDKKMRRTTSASLRIKP